YFLQLCRTMRTYGEHEHTMLKYDIELPATSVLSFNIRGSRYSEHHHANNWKNRAKLTRDVIADTQAHLIGLQEVQYGNLDAFYDPSKTPLPHHYAHINGQNMDDGNFNTIVFDGRRFEKDEQMEIWLHPD